MGKTKRKPPRLPGNGGKNKMLMVNRAVKKEELSFNRRFTQQFVTDAAVLAVHDVFGAGEKRVTDFLVALDKRLMQMAESVLEDSKDDAQIEYTKAKLDEALKPLMGKNFRPYDERYSR